MTLIKRSLLILLCSFGFLLNSFATIDLIVSEIKIATNQKQLQQLTGSIVVQNIGNEAISNFNITNLYFSKDNTFSEDDVYAGFISLSDLDAGKTLEKEITGGANQFGINADDSYHYIIAIADTRNELSESNEENNSLSTSVSITNCEVDLTLDSYQKNSPDILKHGDLLYMSVVLKNLGADNINSVNYDYYLSLDETFDGQDIKIGHINYTAFNWTNSASSTDDLPISPTVTPNYYNVFIRITQEGQEIDIPDSDLNNNIVMLSKIYIDYSDNNTTLNFDQDFGTRSWTEDGLSWSFESGWDNIRQNNPYAGSSHAMYSANGDGAKLTCSETFNAYGLWLLIDDMSDEISSLKIVGYANNGSEKYSLNIDKHNFNFSYSYLTLNWIDIKSIQFISTTNKEIPTSSIFYDELDYRPFSQIPTLLTPKQTQKGTKAYPTIVTNYITIESDSKISMLEVYNANGTLIKTNSINGLSNYQLELTNLQSGNYFLKIKTEENSEMIKIIKR